MPQKCFMIKASWMPPMKSTGPRGRIKSHPLQLHVTSKVCGIVGQSHREGTTLTSKSHRVTRWFETPTCQAFQTTAASELNRRRFLFRIWDPTLVFFWMVLLEETKWGNIMYAYLSFPDSISEQFPLSNPWFDIAKACVQNSVWLNVSQRQNRLCSTWWKSWGDPSCAVGHGRWWGFGADCHSNDIYCTIWQVLIKFD